MNFHHLGLAVLDINVEIDYYRSIGGSQFSPITNDELQNVKICFFMLGGLKYELVSPLNNGSPVDNYLRKNIRMYHTCYEVLDLNNKIEDFINKGALLVVPPTPAIALNNSKIAFLLTGKNDLIELLENKNEN